MLEQLMNPERLYGEPQYGKLSKEISCLRQKLMGLLNSDGQAWLEQLSDQYIRQGNAMLPDAFEDGFWTAVELMLEFQSWKSSRKSTPHTS